MMKRLVRFLTARCAAWVAAFTLGGCASREALPKYYVLTPVATAAVTTNPGAANHRGKRIFIRRVTLPGYLASTQIASRRADSQIEYSPTTVWAEGHREGFGRALAAVLSLQPGVGAVSAPPMGIPPARDYDLVVNVERFEGDDRGEVVLAARWELYRPESATPILSRESRFVQTGWTYGDEANQVRLLGMNVRELAGQIAAVLKR